MAFTAEQRREYDKGRKRSGKHIGRAVLGRKRDREWRAFARSLSWSVCLKCGERTPLIKSTGECQHCYDALRDSSGPRLEKKRRAALEGWIKWL